MSGKIKIMGFGLANIEYVWKDDVFLSQQTGGSIMNTGIDIRKAGQEFVFFTNIGVDHVGDVLLKKMKEYGINTDAIIRNITKTTVSCAFLTDDSATYDLYEGTVIEPKIFDFSVAKDCQYAIFGARQVRTEINKPNMSALMDFCDKHKIKMYYDINAREAMEIDEWVEGMLRRSSFLKVSTEDLTMLPKDFIKRYEDTAIIIHTDEKFVRVHHKGQILAEVECPAIKVVCPIGAGDAFNAGFLCCESDKMEDKVEEGIKLAQMVCQRMEAHLG